jgi:hypothetical protein
MAFNALVKKLGPIRATSEYRTLREIVLGDGCTARAVLLDETGMKFIENYSLQRLAPTYEVTPLAAPSVVRFHVGPMKFIVSVLPTTAVLGEWRQTDPSLRPICGEMDAP